MIHHSHFHSDFIFGVSTSAYQTEGAFNSDGKGLSIWDEFTERKKAIKSGHHAKVATNFYKKFSDDLYLVNQMNCKNLRVSISWARIFPEGIGKINQHGVAYYHKLFDYCLEMEIRPWVTIYHWDLPLELQQKGGWVNRDILNWFEQYCGFVFHEYGDKVNDWMVLNEPAAFVGLGYFLGIHAPGVKGKENFLAATHHACLAQSLGGKVGRSINASFNLGTTFSFSPVEAFRQNKKDLAAAIRVDALINRLYLEPLLGMNYPTKDLPFLNEMEKWMAPNDLKELAFNFDFIGVQNYSKEVIAHSYFTPYIKAKLISAKKRNKEYTAMGWEFCPEIIENLVLKLNGYANIPALIITESGVPLDDKLDENNRIKDVKRIRYYQQNLTSLKKCVDSGINVKGYFCWAMTDNFEWAEGYHPKFGLIHVDFTNQKRVPKDSFYWYQNFLAK